jgi:hypothetical protein
MDINFYPQVRSRADIGCNRGYGCGRIFAISDLNLISCHPYTGAVVSAALSAWKVAAAVSVHPNPDLRSSAIKGAAMRP